VSGVDPKVYELAEAFVDDTLRELRRSPAPAKRAELIQRAASAMQRAIEDECEDIHRELVDERDYADAVDSGTGPVLERDR
jgi:hypothetical protein